MAVSLRGSCAHMREPAPFARYKSLVLPQLTAV